jgi:hypothetical protein
MQLQPGATISGCSARGPLGGATALHVPSARGHDEIVQQLLARLVEIAAQVLEEPSVNNSYEEERMVAPSGPPSRPRPLSCRPARRLQR